MSVRLGDTAPDSEAATSAGKVSKGQDMIVVSAVSTEDAHKGFTETKPYLRTAPDPSD